MDGLKMMGDMMKEKNQRKIFIVEDDEGIKEELQTFLSRYGYEVVSVIKFEQVLQEIEEAQPDLVLLDINLPVFDGYYLCRELRKKSDLPIMMVTSKNSDMDELMSMNLGADDFITKPYNTDILLARIEAILKRTYGNSQQGKGHILQYKGLELHLASGHMTTPLGSRELTKNELKILAYLMQNQGTIVSRETLMEVLWESDIFIDDNTLSVNMTRLRKKLEELGMMNIIETRRGLGYIMS